jgi:hypothetical protein
MSVNDPKQTQPTRERDMDAALDTAARCRLEASRLSQMGFKVSAKWHLENAKAAERWAAHVN